MKDMHLQTGMLVNRLMENKFLILQKFLTFSDLLLLLKNLLLLSSIEGFQFLNHTHELH